MSSLINQNYYKISKDLHYYRMYSGRKKADYILNAFKVFSKKDGIKRLMGDKSLDKKSIPSKADLYTIKNYWKNISQHETSRLPSREKWLFVKFFLEKVKEKFDEEPPIKFESEVYGHDEINLLPGIYILRHASTLKEENTSCTEMVISKLPVGGESSLYSQSQVKWVFNLRKNLDHNGTIITADTSGWIYGKMGNLHFSGKTIHTQTDDQISTTDENIIYMIFNRLNKDVTEGIDSGKQSFKLNGLLMGVARGHGDSPYCARATLEYISNNKSSENENRHSDHEEGIDEALINHLDLNWNILLPS